MHYGAATGLIVAPTALAVTAYNFDGFGWAVRRSDKPVWRDERMWVDSLSTAAVFVWVGAMSFWVSVVAWPLVPITLVVHAYRTWKERDVE
jgi:hypothetical protein